MQHCERNRDSSIAGAPFCFLYAATVLLFLAMPLVLGSVYAFIVFLIYPVIIAKRIRNEEALLERELGGYREYMQKVTYRTVPFVW